jgi:hypothetical protein
MAMGDGGIDPPQAPQAPAPPSPSAPGVATLYGSADPKVLVRQVLAHLQKKVAVDLSDMPNDYLASMEAALVDSLTRDELAAFGLEIRRILRFQRASNLGLVQGSGGQSFTIADAGKETDSLSIKRLVDKIDKTAVTVEARKAVKTSWARSGEAYTLELSGAKGCSWIQFMWRQITLKRGSATTSLQLRVDHGDKPFLLTSNAKTPRWSTDALHWSMPFYEKDTTLIRSSTMLRLSDAPSAMADDVAALVTGADPPSEVKSLFRAATYLVRGREVFCVARIEMDWLIENKSKKAVAKLLRQEVKLSTATELAAAHRAALARQYPQSDYFPGPPIEPPVPDDPFEPVSAKDPLLSSWPAGQAPIDNAVREKRYQAAAQIARAQLIEDVPNRNPPLIAPGRTTRGLNFDTSLKAQGQTGFIDAASKYHNPDIPLSRADALPRIAILLGKSAFEWTTSSPTPVTTERAKDYTIATVRHEMQHARHAKLAIGWLLRWRDQLTKQSFEKWLDSEHPKWMSDVDYHLVRVALAKGTAPTEIFAWLEGFLTAVPFLPPTPKLSDVPGEKNNWPAAISELDGALKEYNMLNMLTLQRTFGALMTRRVVDYACTGLSKPERDVLAAWLKALIDPKALSPATPDDEKIVANLRAEAGKSVSLLSDMRKGVLACK